MHLRQIVQDREVSQAIEDAIRQYRMVDEAMQAIDWTLAHQPEKGVHRSGRYWAYVQTGMKLHRIPEIVVLYSFTDIQVTLHAIVFRPAE